MSMPVPAIDLAVFEERKIRRVYDEKTETWYFSVVDIVAALTEQDEAMHPKTRPPAQAGRRVYICFVVVKAVLTAYSKRLAAVMTTISTGTSSCMPMDLVLSLAIFSTTSMPSVTLPNTQ